MTWTKTSLPLLQLTPSESSFGRCLRSIVLEGRNSLSVRKLRTHGVGLTRPRTRCLRVFPFFQDEAGLREFTSSRLDKSKASDCILNVGLECAPSWNSREVCSGAVPAEILANVNSRPIERVVDTLSKNLPRHWGRVPFAESEVLQY